MTTLTPEDEKAQGFISLQELKMLREAVLQQYLVTEYGTARKRQQATKLLVKIDHLLGRFGK